MLRLLLCLSLVFISTGCQGAEKPSEEIDQNGQTPAQVSMELLDYEVVEKKDISFAGTPRMTYRIILNEDELPNEEQMRRTAEAIWRDGNEQWSEFTVFMYMPEMNIGGVAYGVAEFERSGLTDLKVQNVALYGTKWRSLEEETKQADEEWVTEKQAEGIEEYTVSLEVSKASSRQIEISVDTNFPDGTNFLVDVTREYHQKGDPETYAGDIFSRDIIVKNGKVELSVDVNDADWHSEFQQKKNQFEGMGIFSDISNISPEVEVRVMFSPRRDQPAHVLETLGRNAENVKGPGAKRTGNFTTYSVSRQVSIPFKK